jgi:glyoxylase-like metal-dependent hydrolase (beta-lactamase superfamily II)
MRNLFLFLLIVISSNSFGQTPKLKITHLVENFYIFTTYQSFNGELFPANGMYLLTNEGAILFDTPWDTTQCQPLLDSIKTKHNQEVILCIATHAHDDRTGGFAYYQKLGIKTFATEQTDQICQKEGIPRPEFILDPAALFNVGNITFEVFYPGQGHTSDNIVIWFASQRILYGGCLVKSVEAQNLGYLGDANIDTWSQSIKNIQKRFGKPNFVITGHQSWLSPKSLKHTKKLVRRQQRKSKK